MSDNVEPKEEFLAFPLTFDHPQNNQRYVHTGMTLRDYFAASALTGYLAAFAGPEVTIPPTKDAAEKAYRFADAMMKARDESE
jgi:hypothetical protein